MTTPGALIAGRYRLRTRVASGGMGSVWEADDEVLGRRVAVKMLLPQPGTSPVDAEIARSRVIREARITARLHHPHAVTLYDVVDHAGQPCLIMQFVPSRSLNAILQERGVLPEQVAARIGAELASALTAAHLAGIVHRDIKPSNVLITPDGAAKLTDFGISHAAGDVNLTSTGMVSGTPAYLAPEVARGAPSGFPADVFSLGATLYATLEGAPPFGTDVNPMAILHRVASGQVILPRRSGSLTPLLLHMLAPMPGNRPTMADVARDLAAHAIGSQPAPEPDRPTTELPPPTVREWPSEPAVRTPSLSDSLLGAARLADPPGMARATSSPPSDIRGASAAATGPERRRRMLLLGAVLGVVLIGLVVLGISLLARRDGGGTGVAQQTGTPSSGAASTTRATTYSARPSAAAKLPAAGVAGPSTTPPLTTRSTSSPTRQATTTAAKTTPSPTRSPSPSPTRSPSPSSSSSPSPATTPGTSSSSTPSSRTTTSSSSTSSSPSAPSGEPTADQLAAAVNDYYAQLPTGTDNGWAHLTSNFRTKIAHGRGNYQTFWDRIESVTLSNVRGTAPGTVQATVTYYLKNGRTSVEPTRYRLVRSDGILKIDSQQ